MSSDIRNNLLCKYLFHVDSVYLSWSSTNVSFVVNNENQSATKCYNISADFKTESICDLFRQGCSSLHLLTELSKSNENDSVSITVGKAEIVVEIPDKCRCLTSSTSDDINDDAVTAATSDNSNNDAVIAASVLSVLVAIAIAGVIVVLIFYCRKIESHVIER